ncbi:MAG: DUF4178 domain-containing protein [Myxococcales bacterium]
MDANVAFNAKEVKCPGCGAPMFFQVGTSRLKVCDSCHTVVARGDQGLETFGKVADLAPTGAKLTLGLQGKLKGVGFRIVGRTQLKWAQGVWDEWYVAFDNGKWGWLAEAQGRYYLSFPVPDRAVPPWSALRPGKAVPLGELGRYVASDLKRAQYVAASGELPERIPIDGQNVRTADLTGDKGGFATLDYGVEGDEADVYVGREVPFAELGLDASKLQTPPKHEKIGAKGLKCPKCNGPIELKVPDQTMRVACQWCGSLLDTTSGTLQHLAQHKKRSCEIPLGSKGTFAGVVWLAVGWMERRCTVEGIDYFWEEYLLYDEKTANFRFLVNSMGHWSFVEPVPAGEVVEGLRGPVWKGKLYRTFSEVDADVTGVVGEFYWAVALGEKVHAVDYVNAPEALSEEQGADEVNWSHAVYLTSTEVAAAFKLAKALRPPQGVGMMQPNPWEEHLSGMKWWVLAGLAGVFFIFILLSTRTSKVVFDETYQPVVAAAPASAPPPAAPKDGEEVQPGQDIATDPAHPENGTVRISAPFRIEQAHRNLEAELETSVDNTWGGVAAALVNQTTGEVEEFALETSYYHGIDGGESWSEGSRSDSTFLSAVEPGEYVLRVESIWEPNKKPPSVHLKLTHGVARALHFFLALGLILVLPVFAFWRRGAFERARWEESNVGGGGGGGGDDDD